MAHIPHFVWYTYYMAKMNRTQIIAHITRERDKKILSAEEIRKDYGADSVLFALAAHTAEKLDEILDDIR